MHLNINLYLKGEFIIFIKELTQFYKIGKDLGLSRNEINRIVFFSGKHSLVYRIFLYIVLTIITIVVIIIVLVATARWWIYPSGVLYSSAKIDDFKKKK